MLLRAQGQHRAAPQRVLDPRLHGRREVDEREELSEEEVGDEVRLVQPGRVVARLEDGLEDAAHERAVLLCLECFFVFEEREGNCFFFFLGGGESRSRREG